MHFNSKLVLSILATVPSILAAFNGRCTGSYSSGICIYSSSCFEYGGNDEVGKCPYDPNEITCCQLIPCFADDGTEGKCSFINECPGISIPGKCPGGNDFQCCFTEIPYPIGKLSDYEKMDEYIANELGVIVHSEH